MTVIMKAVMKSEIKLSARCGSSRSLFDWVNLTEDIQGGRCVN